ncbi:MAG: transglutaminase-like domain-containing protein, partial [Vallitaleaceae bacterium]|nr:transglutaminase-like domain-containing protein [Vallitaleaceae bacterium]
NVLVEEALVAKNPTLFRYAVLTWDASKYTTTQNEALAAQRVTYFENESIVPLTEDEIIDVLYSYVVENITYDYDKIETLSYDYIPDIDQVLEDGTGICYDYSVLLASMLRSQDIPTKLIKGYTVNTPVYHAWNEVYSSSKEEWMVVDTTFDAYYYQNKISFEFHKDADDYDASKAF